MNYFIVMYIAFLLARTSLEKVRPSTECGGEKLDNSCTRHTLECFPPELLVIKDGKYGFIVSDAECLSCENSSRCCRDDASKDCLEDFTDDHMSKVYQKCSGVSNCSSLSPINARSNKCPKNTEFYAYTTIQYICNKDLASARVDFYFEDSNKIDVSDKSEIIVNYLYQMNGKKQKKVQGCSCRVEYITYIYFYQTNEKKKEMKVAGNKAESDTWYKIDDGLGFNFALPKHDVFILLRAKNLKKKIKSLNCNCYSSQMSAGKGEIKLKAGEINAFFEWSEDGIDDDINGEGDDDDDDDDDDGDDSYDDGADDTDGKGVSSDDGNGDNFDDDGVDGIVENVDVDQAVDDHDSDDIQDKGVSNERNSAKFRLLGYVLGPVIFAVVVIVVAVIICKRRTRPVSVKHTSDDHKMAQISKAHYDYIDHLPNVSVSSHQACPKSEVICNETGGNVYHTVGDSMEYNYGGANNPKHTTNFKTDTYSHIGSVKVDLDAVETNASTYDHISSEEQNSNVRSSSDNTDSYNRKEIIDVPSANTYNHIGGVRPMAISSAAEDTDTYNHIGGAKPERIVHLPSVAEDTDTYNHIGGAKPERFINLPYAVEDADTYNHIGGAKLERLVNLPSVAEDTDTYNHIGGAKPENIEDLPIISEVNDTYSHI